MALNDPLVHELSMEDYMAAAVGLHGRTPGYYQNLAQAAKNWLADHEGWGPKPAVSVQRLAEAIACARDVGPATGYRMLSDHLRERGIGLVTE